MVIHLKLIILYSTSSIVYDLLSFATLPLSVMQITVMQFILLLGLSCKEIHAMNSCRIPSCVMRHASCRLPTPGKLNTIHSLIKLILKLGTDPNAIDEMGRTPLHILAGMKKHHLNKYLPFFQTLVNAGSYLDVAKNNDETVRSVLKKTMMRYTQKGEMVDPYFESLIDSALPLTCLCTRVIRRHRIPYQDRLPLILQKLVAP